VKVFLTGGTGFIGGHVARALRARGDDVVALVRSPERASMLRGLSCELITGNVTDTQAMQRSMAGCDAVIHSAGVYKVGIPIEERPAMYETNVRGTQEALDVAVQEGVGRIVYISTVNLFGNTMGEIVDETYTRPPGDPYLSYYDQTKFLAHQVALARIAQGAPVVIMQPGGVYGPGDHSEIGRLVEQMTSGRLLFMSFPELGFNFVHVEDVAQGILLGLDGGRVGHSYVLGGEITTLGTIISRVASIVGKRPPRFSLPTWLARAAIPFGPLVGRMLHQPPNLRELISAADGVTYWATDGKARHELGYAPRDLDSGLRQTVSNPL